MPANVGGRLAAIEEPVGAGAEGVQRPRPERVAVGFGGIPGNSLFVSNLDDPFTKEAW